MKSSIAILWVLAVAIAVCAGIFASADPDGLEKVIRLLKIEHRSGYSPEPLISYAVGAIKHPTFSAVLGGIIGILLIIFIFHSILHLRHLIVLLAKLMRAEKRENDVK